MALIKCPECGREVSDKAAACPQCAYPIAGVSVPMVPSVVEPLGNKAPMFAPPENTFDKEQEVANLFALRVGLQDIADSIVGIKKESEKAIASSEEIITDLWENVRAFKDEFKFSAHLGFAGQSGNSFVFYARQNPFYDKIWKLIRDKYNFVNAKDDSLETLEKLFESDLSYNCDYSRLQEKTVMRGLEILKEMETLVNNVDEKSAVFFDEYQGLRLDNEFGDKEARQRFVFNVEIRDGCVFEKSGMHSTEKTDMKNKKLVVKNAYDVAEVRAYYTAVRANKEKFVKLLDPFKAILKHCIKIAVQKECIQENRNNIDAQKKSKFPKLQKAFESLVQKHTLIHESDFGAADYMLYLFITNRADTMKEALQLLDSEKRDERLDASTEEASSYIERNFYYIINNLGKKFTKALQTLSLNIKMEQLTQIQATMMSSGKIAQIIREAQLNAYRVQ
ncbi:MAG: hypothetical protein FWD76_00990 [Firmicutes bacterium]|nr:hypothetical protein [Bacillota bacterium]